MHRTYGVSLSFKTDPFKSVKINTSFDENPAIADMLQASLEGELRELFTTGIPELVHKLSLQKLRERQAPSKPKPRPKPRPRAASVKSMPSSPELRRSVSHNPQATHARTRSRPLSRLDSNPSPVARQLTTHHLQHNTLSPYSRGVADDHVMHRGTALASASTPNPAAATAAQDTDDNASPAPTAVPAPAPARVPAPVPALGMGMGLAAPAPVLASPQAGLHHHLAPSSPLVARWRGAEQHTATHAQSAPQPPRPDDADEAADADEEPHDLANTAVLFQRKGTARRAFSGAY
jgi:hypothetical protein